MKTKLSGISIGAFTFLFLAGMGYGYYRYLHRPATFPANIPSHNAIPIHIAIAICALVSIVVIQMYRSRKQLSNIWTAPFSQNALQRLKATFRPRPFTIVSIPRIVIAIPLLIVMLFSSFRGGSLFTANLAPSEPSNAWGGPSYLGATAAHLMDLIIIVYVAAFILRWLMVKQVSSASKK